MDHTSELEHVHMRLEELTRALVAGSAESIEREAAALEPGIETLRQLHETPPPSGGPVLAKLAEIRDQSAQIREMLDHAELVRQGVAGIIGALYEAHTGSQYSAHGTPTLAMAPRVVMEA